TVAVGPKTGRTVLRFAEDSKAFARLGFGSSPGLFAVWPGLFGGANDATTDTKRWNTTWNNVKGSHASVLLIESVCAPEMVIHFLCPYSLFGDGRLLTLSLA